MRKIPQRRCVICKTQKNKNELLRVVKNKENEIKVDTTGKEPGRGAYICYNIECLEKAMKTKKLEKELEVKIDNEIYMQVQNIIKEKNGGDVIG